MEGIRKRVQNADSNHAHSHSNGSDELGHAATVGQPQRERHRAIRELWRLPFYNIDPTRSQLMYLLIFLFYIYIGSFVIHHDGQLPSPKPASILTSEYSEVRAREHLYAMSANGIRNTGEAANEVYAARYIVSQLLKIREELRPGFTLDVEIQRPSGYFDLNFLGGFTSSYQNVTNILARLYYGDSHDKVNRTDVSFLVSAHFDSAMGSPAASDDLANIASMIEIVRNLAHMPPLPHAVIFNFNGAEESILQAAHGFITQHPWAETIGAFLNGEGAGGAGRELTFQLGPSNAWLAFLYARSVPYPFASSLAQDIFQSGIIPSDTDFRIYRDFGGLAGIDMAYITDGWVYHTPLDDIAHVPAGSMQRAGENILALIVSIASSPQLFYAHPRNRHYCLEHPQIHQTLMEKVRSHGIEMVNVRREMKKAHEKSHDNVSPATVIGDNESLRKANITDADDHAEYVCDENDFSSYAVFFDAVGTLAVIYSSRTAFWLNGFAIIASLVYLAYQHTVGPYHTVQRTLYSMLVLLGGWLASLAACLSIAGVLLLIGHPMKWFSYPVLSVGLYIIPTVLVSFSIQRNSPRYLFASLLSVKDKEHSNAAVTLHSHSKISVWIAEEQCYLTTLSLWCLFLIVFFVIDISSAFVFTLMTLLPMAGRIIGKMLDRLLLSQQIERFHQHSWLFLVSYMASILMPALLMSYAWYVVIYFFMPVMGRSGDVVPSEVVMAAIISLATLIITTLTISLVHLDKGFLLRKPLITISVASFVVALLLPSYTPAHPKRIILNHVTRHWHSHHLSQHNASVVTNISVIDREDSGLWVNSLDWQALEPIRPVTLNRATEYGLSENAFRRAAAMPCDGVYCSMPYYYPFKEMAHSSWYLPAQALPDRYKGTLTLVKVVRIPSADDRNRRRYHFVSVGSHHQTLFINNVADDEFGAELIGWSFFDPAEAGPHNECHLHPDLTLTRPSPSQCPFTLGPFYDAETAKEKALRREYFVFFSSGTPDWDPHAQSSVARSHPPVHLQAPIPVLTAELERVMPTLDTLAPYNERRWEFWLEVRDNPSVANDRPSETMPLRLAIGSHYLGESTPLLDAAVEDMPDWTTVVHWSAKWDGYEFR